MKVNNIRLIRESKGVTMYRLAKEADISAPYLLDLERNARGAKPETLERIAAALGVEVSELTGDNDTTSEKTA